MLLCRGKARVFQPLRLCTYPRSRRIIFLTERCVLIILLPNRFKGGRPRVPHAVVILDVNYIYIVSMN